MLGLDEDWLVVCGPAAELDEPVPYPPEGTIVPADEDPPVGKGGMPEDPDEPVPAVGFDVGTEEFVPYEGMLEPAVPLMTSECVCHVV